MHRSELDIGGADAGAGGMSISSGSSGASGMGASSTSSDASAMAHSTGSSGAGSGSIDLSREQIASGVIQELEQDDVQVVGPRAKHQHVDTCETKAQIWAKRTTEPSHQTKNLQMQKKVSGENVFQYGLVDVRMERGCRKIENSEANISLR